MSGGGNQWDQARIAHGKARQAEVVELSVTAGGAVRVHPVICTVDCGMLVNPDAVVAQMESGIVFGLTAALYGEIPLDNGRVQQSRFHNYPLLRKTEMPVIDVHILPSVRPLAEWESLVRRPLRRQ